MQLRPFSMGQTVFSLSGDPGNITVLQHSTIPLMTQNHPESMSCYAVCLKWEETICCHQKFENLQIVWKFVHSAISLRHQEGYLN